MKYSYNWLKELSGTKLSPEKIVEAITMHSFEVEGAEHVGSDLKGVIVGEILEIEKHPNADKLQLTKVNIGKEILGIVCGAHNISVGDKVPVALVGTKLPNGTEIKEAEIRGEKSHGMLCAADELGLGTDHSGIIILDKNAKIGGPVANLLSEKDTVFEIKILPDRAHDALSHVGMAREIAAIAGEEIDYDYDGLVLPKVKTKKISVKIEKSPLCERYIMAVLENVQVSKSPGWLSARLENCGIRSINNVVDVTNYVMLEIGQPMHAFDLEKIDSEIIVRSAKNGEKITILDGSEKELNKDDILISTRKEAIALAGVMGGKDSGVSEITKTIVLESATFNPAMIRKTKNRLNLLTDAAQRFEKGIDPNLAEKAMVRAIELLEHIANAKLEGIVDEYSKEKKSWTIKLQMEYVNKLLGENIPVASAKKILKSLGFLAKGNEKELVVEVPTFRLDALAQEDLTEEIGRIYGYEKIRPIAPLVTVASPKINEKRNFERNLKNILATQGFSEVLGYAFYGQREANLSQLGSIKHLELLSPLTPEHSLLRVSLIPNILKNVAENLKREKNFQIFEIGRVFWPDGGVLPEEKAMLLGAVALDLKDKKESLQDKRHQSPFFAAKALVDDLMIQLGITDHYYDSFNGSPIETPRSLWHEGRSAEIKFQGHEKAVGYIGEINPFTLANFGIQTRIAMFELDLEQLRKISDEEMEYQPLRKFPTVSRDISMIVKQGVLVDEVLSTIQRIGGDMILDVDLFDMFDFADTTTSFAFRILIGADDRTLTSSEVDDIISKIITELETELEVEVRK
jgi:phenylalanyl-tRNA synthetase beta chain